MPEGTASPVPSPRRYSAFVSYRHADNTQEGRRWAEWLHRALERYVVPPDLIGRPNLRGEPICDSLYPIFRDEDELPANADLATGIRAALEVSDHLVVLCSPRSAVSPWVRKEVREFKELGRSDRILAIIIAGEPNADDPAKAREGIMRDEECFCEELRFGVPVGSSRRDDQALAARTPYPIDWTARTEPTAADLRPIGTRAEGFVTAEAYREHLTLHSSHAPEKIVALTDTYRQRLDQALLKVIAGLLGVPLGQLIDRDAAHRAALAEREVARQREIAERERHAAERLQRRNRVLAAFAAGILILAAIASGLWRRAEVERMNAEVERQRAKEGEAAAQTAKALADEARSKAVTAERQATAMLVEAARSDRVVAARLLGTSEAPSAFAHLARAIAYDPKSTLAAEKAVAALNDWNFLLPEHVFQGHFESLHSVQFSPDGQRIVTTAGDYFDAKDRSAKVWDAKSGKLLFALTGHEGGVTGAEFSPNGQRIVTVSFDNTARTWEASSGKLLTTITGHVRTAHFSPDGLRLVTACDDRCARIWEAETGKLVATLSGHDNWLSDAQFSADGERIVTTAADNSARVWDLQSGKTLQRFPISGHDCVGRLSPNGQQVVTPSQNGAQVWSTESGEILFTLEGHKYGATSARFSPDGQRIVTASYDKTARIWEARNNGRLLATLEGHTDILGDAQFSSDGQMVVTISDDKTAKIWNAWSGTLLASLQGHEEKITGARFSPDGESIVTISDDKTARLWIVKGGKLLVNLYNKANWFFGPVFSHDGRLFATFAGSEKDAWILDARSGKVLATVGGHGDSLSSVQLSSDGKRMVTASQDRLGRVWDVESGKLLATLTGHEEGVSSARFSSDGGLIVTTSSDKTARIWETQSGKWRVTLSNPDDGMGSAQFSHDGRLVVTTGTNAFTGYGSNIAKVWDAETGKQLVMLTGHTDTIEAAKFSPVEPVIATASSDGTARVWEARSGREIATLAGHENKVHTVQFSADGRRIVTASSDKTARIWKTQNGQLLATLNGHTNWLIGAQFSPDGERIISSSSAETILLWDAQSGRPLEVLDERTPSSGGAPNGFDVSPDGQRVVSIYCDNHLSIWTILPSNAGAPPAWFRDFLHYLGQKRLDADGELQTIVTADWLELKKKLQGVMRTEKEKASPYLDVLRHFLRE